MFLLNLFFEDFIEILGSYFVYFFWIIRVGLWNKNIYISNYRQYNIYNGEKEVKCTKKEDKQLWNF